VALAGAYAVVTWPVVAAFALITMASTVFLPEFKTFAVAGIRSDLPEATAFLLIGCYLLRLVLGLDRPPPGARGLVVFVTALVCGSLVGLSRGADRQLLQGEVKSYLLYLLIIPMAAVFGTRARKQLLESFVVLASSVGCVWILFRLVRHLPITSPDRIYDFNTLGTVAGVERVRSALLELLVVATMLVFARALSEGATPLRVLQLVLFSVIWAESYFRSAWLGLLVGAALIVAVQRRPGSSVRVARLTLVLAAVVPLLAIGAASGHLGKPAHEVLRRVESTISPKLSAESSFTDRQLESEDAVAALRRNPLVGVGIARPYGASRAYYDPVQNVVVFSERQYSHNTYFDVWLHLGLAGLLCVVALGVMLYRAVRNAVGALPPADATRCLAAGAACLALGAKAVFIPQLLYRPAILALVVAVTLALPAVQETDD